MNPQQQYPNSTPNPDYSFIFQNQPKKTNPFKGTGSVKKRLINVLIIVAILILIIVIVFSFLGNAGNSSKTTLVELAAYQIKLQSLAEEGADNTSSTLIKNTATIAQYSLETDLQQTLLALNKQGVKTTVKKISTENGSSFSSDVKQLENAKKNGDYDEVFKKTFDARLLEYQKQIKATYGTQKSKSFKASLENSNKNALLVSFSNKEN